MKIKPTFSVTVFGPAWFPAFKEGFTGLKQAHAWASQCFENGYYTAEVSQDVINGAGEATRALLETLEA